MGIDLWNVEGVCDDNDGYDGDDDVVVVDVDVDVDVDGDDFVVVVVVDDDSDDGDVVVVVVDDDVVVDVDVDVVVVDVDDVISRLFPKPDLYSGGDSLGVYHHAHKHGLVSESCGLVLHSI